MINDWTSMISQIISWVDHDDINTAIATDLIQLGEKRIYREIRTRTMEATLNVTIASGVAALPTDFVGLKTVRLSGSPDKPLGIKSDEYIYAKYPTRSSSSKPDFCAVEASNLIFGPYPDSTYTVKGIYYKRLTALSASNTTNYFTGDGADALFWASMVEAEPFVKNDPRVQLWEMKYMQAKQGINNEQRGEHFRGPLRTEAR